ncbi:hypothetical protein [Nocardia sp. 348MFTsu5.1]|uniref:hypothetical protein n=1 Tax=Nocardia sp. 348MFTsu5.1 TaxID=1172185 RepID=UPI0003641D55|nr:hypothetical protein [Nocardia sp. 348MFTsu5.1]
MMGTPLAAEYPAPPESPRRRRLVLWLVVVALILVIATVVAIALLGVGESKDDGAAPSGLPTGAPPASTGEDGYLPDTVDRYGQQIRVPRDPAGLPLLQTPPKVDREVNDPATGVQWQRVYEFGAALFSTSDGPTSINTDGLAQGISHTPQGSVIAASQIIARAYFGPTQVRQTVMTQQVIGPDSAKAMVLDLDMPARQYAIDRFARVDPQYSDTFSRVSLASGPKTSSEYPSGQYYGVTTLTMVWDQGQWKWRIPDDGFTNATADTRVESVVGWAQW